jgi:hypothetical protein
MALTGINYDLDSKDFFFDVDGNTAFIEGKERNVRNFVKMLLTESGNVSEVDDTDERYNPRFGLDYAKMYAPVKEIQEAVTNVKGAVKRSVTRFIEQQQSLLAYYDENEIFVRGVVNAYPYYTTGVYFTIELYTAEDVRLGRQPSFEKSFTTTRTIAQRR